MASSTYEGRRVEGDKFEPLVQDELWLRGWYTEAIGRGAMSAVMNEKLGRYFSRGHDNCLSHIPDLVTVSAKRDRAYLINAKADGGDSPDGTPKWLKTGNHCVQIDSMRGLDAAVKLWGIPGVFVFDDWTYATTDTIREH